MTRKRLLARKGSKRWIQLAVNDYPDVLYDRVVAQLHSKPSKMDWLSPLRCDEFTEYRDQKFIDCLGLKLRKRSLKSFWPSGGPRWDALGKTDNSQVLLVEGKAHIGEMKGTVSVATNCKSKEMIARSLSETQKFLGANQSIDWAQSPYYQYANRLAHLYLLAELNGIDAYLLMIYFLNNEKKRGPDSSDLWDDAIQRQYVHMGLPQEPPTVRPDHVNLYLDVHELGG